MEIKLFVYLKAFLIVTTISNEGSSLIQTSNDQYPITFLDCAGSSLLVKLVQSQEELTVYSSTPEVRLKVPRNILEEINLVDNGDHVEYLRRKQYVIRNEPLYGEVLRQSQLKQFLQIYKLEDSSFPVTCGGCVYHALALDGSSEDTCPSDNIEVTVPEECVRTVFNIDWIEPHEYVNERDEYEKRTDVIREGPAPGDGFTPGIHQVTYLRDSDAGDSTICNFTVRVKASCPYDENVRTIIGPMTFNTTLVGDSTKSINRTCPSFRGSNAALPRASAECIYHPQRGPIWKEPADLTDCLKGKSLEERFEIIQGLLDDVKRRTDVPLSEIVEIGLAVDALSRLNVDAEDEELLTEITSILLQELIELNLASEEITNIVLSVVDNFFDRERDDESIVDNGSSLNSIVSSLEAQARNQIRSGSNYTGVEENVALLNVVVGEADNNLVSLSFGNFKANSAASDENVLGNLQEQNLRVVAGRIDEPTNDILTSVSLPENIRTFVAGEELMVSFLLYRDGSLFPTSGVVDGDVEADIKQVVGSQVVAATVYNATDISPVFNEDDQLITTFTPIDVADEDEELLPDRICVFWDFSNGGFWSTEGCTLGNSTSSRIQCQCNHATSFAVLVNVKEQAQIYTWISQLGCAVSVFALLVTILSILSIKNLRQRTSHQVHVSLMIALLGLYMVFLFGADQTQDEGACIGVTAAMHYFLLSSFAWMFMEGILLYKSIVSTKVSGKLPRFIWYASFIAWVLPILPTVTPFILIRVVPDLEMKDFYELNTYCFLKPDSLMMYIGLLGIMASILAFNLVVFILILNRLCCRKEITGKADKRKFTFTFVSIVTVFGLTWSVGFFAIRDASFAVSIVFSLLNAFQGFFLFLIFGVREREVRKFWSSPVLAVTGKGRGSSTGTTGSTKKSRNRRSEGSSEGGRDNPTLEADTSTR